MLCFLTVGICLQSSSQGKDMDREDCKIEVILWLSFKLCLF